MRALPLLAAAPVTSLVLTACPPPAGDDDDTPPAQTVVLGGPAVFQDPGAFTATAAFRDDGSAGPCTIEEIAGACTYATCAGGEAPIAPAPSLDAGDVTLETASQGAVTLVRDGDGAYTPASGDVFFANREEIEATAAGGADVPAFDVDLLAPTRLQMTSPPLPAVNVRVVDPIELAWSNDSEGFVEAVLRDPNGTREARCKGPASAGALTIAPEIVGRFPLGAGTLDVTVFNEASLEVEEKRVVRVEARTHTTAATGGNATYDVTFAAP